MLLPRGWRELAFAATGAGWAGAGHAEKLKLGKLKAEMGLGDYGTTDHRTTGAED